MSATTVRDYIKLDVDFLEAGRLAAAGKITGDNFPSDMWRAWVTYYESLKKVDQKIINRLGDTGTPDPADATKVKRALKRENFGLEFCIASLSSLLTADDTPQQALKHIRGLREILLIEISSNQRIIEEFDL